MRDGGEHISVIEAVTRQFDEMLAGKMKSFVAVRYPAAMFNPYPPVWKWLTKQAEAGLCSFTIERRGDKVAYIVRRA